MPLQGDGLKAAWAQADPRSQLGQHAGMQGCFRPTALKWQLHC